MKKNVFISSTYLDLIDYRKAIWELLEKYKVNVKGMEAFGARKETPLETCLNEVNQSDIYVGIIAHRFGSIDVVSGKSFTQLEYERAITENKEILIYIINDDIKVAIEDIDFGDKRDKLLNFKSYLKEKHTVDTFTTPENLVTKLKSRFDELLVENPNIESSDHDYELSKNVIDRFTILPKMFSDRDVRITIEFKGDAFPLSREICSAFGFIYGKTIGVPINISKPEIKNNIINSLIIEEKDIELYFSRKDEPKIEIIARLLFSDKRIDQDKGQFFDRKTVVYEENPNYNPSIPSYDTYSMLSALSLTKNPRYFETTQVIKGEGKAILVLKSIVSE
ncbi:MAG: DUF4062 domain-containing protein [Bacteroidales bacterium]|nr:DUF4062 domain-containing protein [Bacteroidales bacterium]